MELQQITKFATPDGKEFDSQEEAQAHMRELELESDIEDYKSNMLANGIEPSIAAARCNSAKHYLLWKASGVIKRPRPRKANGTAAQASS